jgi:VWFA-related protein
MRLPLHRCIPPTLILCAFALVHAQTPAPDADTPKSTVKLEVRVILVDVAVTQKNGKPVSNLPRENFQVLEDGRPQTITFFEEHKGTPASSPEVPASDLNTYTNVQAGGPADSMSVLLLDWLNTQPQDRKFVQTQIAEYLRKTPAGTPLAAFVLGSHLSMVKGPTSDRAALLAAIDNQKAASSMRPSPLLDTAARRAAEQQMVDMMTLMQTAQVGIEAVRQEQADFGASATEQRIRITLCAMEDLGRYLSGIPGRKNVVWFSNSFPIDIFPGKDVPRQYGRELKRVTDLLTEGRISVYPVSASGLGQDSGPTAATGNFRAGEMAGDPAANQIAMESLAKGTGGKAFYNTNGLEEVLTRAIDAASHYYTLTYTPTNGSMDGKFRNIKVKVLRRGSRVTHRQGYYADDLRSGSAADQNSALDTLTRLVRLGMPDVAQIPYSVTVSPTNLRLAPDTAGAGPHSKPKQPKRRYALDFNIPATSLKLEASAKGEFHDGISTVVVAYNLEGKVLGVVKKKSDITLPLDEYAYTREHGLRVRSEIDIPTGDVLLRTGISEENSPNAGTLGIALSESAIVAEIQQSSGDTISSAVAASSSAAPAPVAHGGITAEMALAKHDSDRTEPNAGDHPSNLDLGSSCRIEEVLPKVATHIKEFVESMNQFTATEVLERDRLDRNWKPKVQVRSKSNYVVTIRNLGSEGYDVSEFRNDTEGVGSFEGDLAASGAPALALIFHPTHLEEFDMTCDGPVNWQGRDTWKIHFRQRTDRPSNISSFSVGHKEFSLLLKGTAWIDAANYQLLHLETDLLQPIPEEKLDMLHQSINYSGVAFATRHTTLWLPQVAEITAEFGGQRFRDRHTFSEFRLFAVDTGQKIKEPTAN